MLTFRDNSWYQSGNSDFVRDGQREKQREKERAGTGRPATGPSPVPPFLSSPASQQSRWTGGHGPGSTQGGRRAGGAGGLGGHCQGRAVGGGLCV